MDPRNGKPNAALTPKFLRASIRVQIDDVIGEYTNQLVSESGVYGLRWPPFVPNKHFGKRVQVKSELHAGGDHYSFEMPALIGRESALRSERMNLTFEYPDPEIRTWVRRLIEEHGHAPHEYTRRYPRIPSMMIAESLRLRALVGGASVGLSRDSQWIPFEVSNLSPEGLLLQSLDKKSSEFRAGDFMNIELQFLEENKEIGKIPLKARIFRVSESVTGENGLLQRSLGTQFTKMDPNTKRIYFNLLSRVLKSLNS